jgi:hypothetical protein
VAVARHPLSAMIRIASIGLVSAYLASVAVLLLLSRRIRVNPRGVIRALAGSIGPRFTGVLTEIHHDQGCCYVAVLGARPISDRDGRSALVLFEDGQPLPYPHSNHDEIRVLGKGRYSHWGEAVLFSSRDNTDPSSNGRRYTVAET